MSKKPTELLRALSLNDAIGIGLGAIIGAGIFVVTGVAAGISGPSFFNWSIYRRNHCWIQWSQLGATGCCLSSFRGNV